MYINEALNVIHETFLEVFGSFSYTEAISRDLGNEKRMQLFCIVNNENCMCEKQKKILYTVQTNVEFGRLFNKKIK